MSEVRFRLPDSATPIRESLSDTPAPVRDYIRRGFHDLAGMPAESQSNLIGLILSRPAGFSDSAFAEIATQMGVDAESLGAAASGLSLFAAYLAERPDTAAELADGFIAAGLVDELHRPLLVSLAERLAPERERLSRNFDQQVMGREVLPSFQSITTTVDVRLRFVDDAVSLAVPMAMVYLATDDANSRMFFQLTKGDVSYLIAELEAVKTRMEGAERWASTQ